MPPEVLEHMARIYDMPHGASPAYGMNNVLMNESDVDMALCKTFSMDELMKQANESSLSDLPSGTGTSTESATSVSKPTKSPVTSSTKSRDQKAKP